MSQNNTPKPPPNEPVVVPDTGKRGVQPIGSVKPYPPRPTPPLAKKGGPSGLRTSWPDGDVVAAPRADT